MLRTNGGPPTSNNTNTTTNGNHINGGGWPTNGKTNGDVVKSATSTPVKSLRDEYFANNNNNNNNHQAKNNNNLNGWSPSPVDSTASFQKLPKLTNGNGHSHSNSPARNNHLNHNGSNGYQTEDESAEAVTNGCAAEREPGEDDQLITNNNNNHLNGHIVPTGNSNGHHHLQGNLRLMNGKVNGCLSTNGSVKQANGNGAAATEKDSDESDPLTGNILDQEAMMRKARMEESEDEANEKAKMRKEAMNGHDGGLGGDGQGDDADDDRICGIGSCRPKWATKLASTKVFMVVFLLAWVLQGMYSTYFVSVITTIEKLFQIQSKVTGMLLSVTEIGQISTALFLTYYAGRGHRPRWIACGELGQKEGKVLEREGRTAWRCDPSAAGR